MIEIFKSDIRLAGNFEALYALAPAQRKAASDKLSQRADKHRCLVAGIMIQRILGAAEVLTTAKGKPYIPGGPEFSVAHSGDLVLLAVAGGSVGVDVEHHRPVNWSKVAERFFTPTEQSWLQRSPDPLQSFFDLWTLKESVVKESGEGISEITLLPVLSEGGEFQNQQDGKHLFQIDLCRGYSAAVCSVDMDFTGEVQAFEI